MRALLLASPLLLAVCGDGGTTALPAQPDAMTVAADAAIVVPDAVISIVPDADIVVADAMAPLDARTIADSGTTHAVPDPGTDPMPNSWPDTEPNDTPEQAVRLGVGHGQIGPYVNAFTGGGHLGGGDAADYFVFRTSKDAGTTFIAGGCWGDLHVNLLDFALYEVVDGERLVLVDSSNSTDTACELPRPFWNLPLAPDTEYLFALTNVEGEGLYQV